MSDIHFMVNDWALPPMSQFGTRCAGHEGAGVIVQVGERVKHLKVGQRAGFKPIVDVCHTCDACRNGKETYCSSAIFTGLMADGKVLQDMLRVVSHPNRVVQRIRRLSREIHYSDSGRGV